MYVGMYVCVFECVCDNRVGIHVTEIDKETEIDSCFYVLVCVWLKSEWKEGYEVRLVAKEWGSRWIWGGENIAYIKLVENKSKISFKSIINKCMSSCFYSEQR